MLMVNSWISLLIKYIFINYTIAAKQNRKQELKVVLSPSQKLVFVCFNESLLQMMDTKSSVRF